MVHAGYKRFVVSIWEHVTGENIHLNTMIIWPWEETGFAFSRYAVTLSSRQRTSACVEPGGNIGARGELGVVCEAVVTILHIGQPAFGVNEAIVDVG